MVQNANSFADVMGVFAPGPGPETVVAGPAGPAAPAVLDCRTALLAPEDARGLPSWQPLAALLVSCRDDPARFQAEVLGRTLWTRQVAVREAVARSPITVVPAGRAVGKSFLLAGLVLWWVNRGTANAFALRRRLDPHRDGFIPFSWGGIPEWPNLRQELAELYGPAMEIQESQVKQLLEAKEPLSARLHRSPDLLDALLMTVSFLHEG